MTPLSRYFFIMVKIQISAGVLGLASQLGSSILVLYKRYGYVMLIDDVD
jgi:hypothetical protein